MARRKGARKGRARRPTGGSIYRVQRDGKYLPGVYGKIPVTLPDGTVKRVQRQILTGLAVAEAEAAGQDPMKLAEDALEEWKVEARQRAPDPESGIASMTLYEFVSGWEWVDGKKGENERRREDRKPQHFAGDFVDAVRADVGDAHLYDLQGRLARAARYFKSQPIREIDTAAARAFLATLSREKGRARIVVVGRDDDGNEVTKTRYDKMSRGTVDRYRAALSRCWEEAILAHLAEENPWRQPGRDERRRPSRTKRFTPRFLTSEEVTAIVDRLAERFRPFFRFLAETGLRLGEAQALQWRRVAPGFERIDVVDAKSRSGVRSVPCSALARDVLESRWEKHVSPTTGDDPVFQPYSRTYLWATWKRACVAAGVGRDVRIHDLRHYFGSSLAQAGIPLSTIQKLLGHGSARMTEIYASHVPENAAEQAIAAFDASRGVESPKRAATR